jgi:NAD(P)H-dependent flavin oxidoreductase YrpB (nitropropane dioxygenase family)
VRTVFKLTSFPRGVVTQLFQDASSLASLRRPRFLPIVASNLLAKTLLKAAPEGVDGFVVEMPKAGGHNAPPRGPMQLDSTGQPIYGPKVWARPSEVEGGLVPCKVWWARLD